MEDMLLGVYWVNQYPIEKQLAEVPTQHGVLGTEHGVTITYT